MKEGREMGDRFELGHVHPTNHSLRCALTASLCFSSSFAVGGIYFAMFFTNRALHRDFSTPPRSVPAAAASISPPS